MFFFSRAIETFMFIYGLCYMVSLLLFILDVGQWMSHWNTSSIFILPSLFSFSLERSADHLGLPTFSHQNFSCKMLGEDVKFHTRLSGLSCQSSGKTNGTFYFICLFILLLCWCEKEDTPLQTLITYQQTMSAEIQAGRKRKKQAHVNKLLRSTKKKKREKEISLPRTKCTTAVNLFLAHRYAAVLIILLVGTGPDPRPVWCNAPLPLCNQAQTRWLKVLLQLPVWKALSYPHQQHYSHGLQTPLGSTHTTPKQSGRLFLPHDKNPSSVASAHWRQLNLFPSPSTVSGFQDGRVIRIWHRWNCWIQHGGLYPFEKKKKEE